MGKAEEVKILIISKPRKTTKDIKILPQTRISN